MDHHVGIAADGRGEVGVVGEGQTVVADVVSGVEGLGHRAHGHRRHGVLLGRTLDRGQQLVELLGHGAPLLRLEDVAEAEDELPETVELLLARGVVYAVDHRALEHAALLAAALAAELRHAAVGQQHELLDHLVRLLLLLEVDLHGAARLVEAELHLVAVEGHGPLLEAPAAQRLRQTVERQHLLGIVAAAGLDDLLRLGIGEAAVGVDGRAAEPLVQQVEVLVEREDGREAEARLVGTQRAELVREPLGQHGYRAVDQIDRRAALDRLVVDHGVGAHVVGHVGDVHADLPHPVARLAHRQGVVEVLGVGRVDGESHRVAEVAAAGDLLLGDAAVDRGRGLLDPGFEAVGQVVLGQYGVHLRVVVARQTQSVDQLARGALAAGCPVDDAHDDLLAVAHVGVGALREIDVHGHAARVGAHEDLVGPHLRHAHIGLAVALQDRDDLALGLAAAAALDDDRLHAVAVERRRGVALVDVDVLLHALDPHVDGAALRHVGDALVAGQVAGREAVFFPRALLDDPLVEEAAEDLERLVAPLLRGAARGRGELLEREFVVGKFAQQAQDHRRAVGLGGPFGGAAFGFSVHDSNNCRARLRMKPMPVSMAPSSGENVAVWGRPAARPTPSR